MVASATLYANYVVKGMICKTEWQILSATEMCPCACIFVIEDVLVRHFVVAVIVCNFGF